MSLNFGLTASEFEFVREHLILPLKGKGASLWVFGSRARGDYQKYSDLDIMVESSDLMEDVIGTIAEFFENSNFPYKLDLVELKKYASSYRVNFEKEKIKL